MKKYLLSLVFTLVAVLAWSQQTVIEWISPIPKLSEYYVHNSSDKLTIKLNISNPLKGTEPYLEINGKDPYANTKAEAIPLNNGYFETKVYIPDNSLQSIVLVLKDGGGKVYHRSKPLIVRMGKEPQPNLYLLAFGPKPPNIDYTKEDATDFERAFSRQACGTLGLYANVISEKFVNEEATMAKMSLEMDRMIKLNTIKPNDVFILLMSSHGNHENGELYIQADDYTPSAPKKTSISVSELFEKFDPVHAQKIFFIDACESGSAQDSSLFKLSLKQETGYTLITSSGFDSKSYHHDKWENGAFTETLLDGLSGKANKTNGKGEKDEFITVYELFEHLEKAVPILCKKTIDNYENKDQQVPEMPIDQLGDIKIFRYDRFCAPLIGGEEVFYKTIKLPQDTIAIGSTDSEGKKISKKEKGENTDEYHRKVTINSPTAMGKYEVINAKYCDFLNDPETNLNNIDNWINLKSPQCKIRRDGTEFKPKAGHANMPVVMVSWDGAMKFAKWLSDKDCIYNYDLPTGNEWEYAARGGQRYQIFSGTNDFDDFNQRKKIVDVTREEYIPNPLGIYDMGTNVSEWCKNIYKEKGEPQGMREVRGGSFKLRETDCRTAKRHHLDHDVMREDLGFRLIQRPKKDRDCE